MLSDTVGDAAVPRLRSATGDPHLAEAPRSHRPLQGWLAAVAGVLIGLTGLGLAWVRHRPLGPPIIEITSPASGDVLGNRQLEVFLLFPEPERTAPGTLRVLLNGADVTGSFETASNGAYGSVVHLVDGENVLRAEVFGRPWWPSDQLVEQATEVRFRVRRPIDRNWG